MKKLVFVILLSAQSVVAAPYIVSDPDPTGAADKCVYHVGANPPVETPTVVTPPAVVGNCLIDTVVFPVGVTNMQIWFRSTVWGVDSAPTPFALGKPGSGGAGPANLRVVP